ncbi:23S rRNA (pseudouridine(1915)-N(3))-methyltransferase RlmH, partial [Bacillus sp. S2-R3J1-FB-BA1]|uniref:23S rRNA (pseudouridine(1915)-N(3))-methyltransferase RlmH n=1 Tax=Bacillus sp. S2-R3J1-FB-BA1 TaxID=1973490 RepID=UPI002100B0F1
MAEYLKRLSAYEKVEVIELPDEKAPENLSEAEMLMVKEKEGIRILDKISDDTHVITLGIEGCILYASYAAAAERGDSVVYVRALIKKRLEKRPKEMVLV